MAAILSRPQYVNGVYFMAYIIIIHERLNIISQAKTGYSVSIIFIGLSVFLFTKLE